MDFRINKSAITARVKAKSVYILALLDQIVFGATASINFIVLENLISRDTYALLATLYSFIVLYQLVSNAMYMDAFVVNLPQVGMDLYRPYFIYILKLFLLVSLISGLVFGGAYLMYAGVSTRSVSDFVLFCSAATSFSLMMFARRLCYSVQSIGKSFLGSLVYILLYAAFIAVGYYLEILSLEYIFLSLAAATFGSFLLVAARLGVLGRLRLGADAGLDRARLRGFHREYAGMGFVAGTLKWIPDNLLFSLLGVWSTLDHVATYRMATNLLMPFRHFIASLVNVLLPKYSHLAVDGRSAEGWRHALGFIFLFLAVSGGMFAIFWFFGREILDLLYRSNIEPVLNVILVLSIVPAFSAAQAISGTFLKSTGKIKGVVLQSMVGAFLTILLGWQLSTRYGAMGAAVTLVISMFAMSVFGIILVLRSQGRKAA